MAVVVKARKCGEIESLSYFVAVHHILACPRVRQGGVGEEGIDYALVVTTDYGLGLRVGIGGGRVVVVVVAAAEAAAAAAGRHAGRQAGRQAG